MKHICVYLIMLNLFTCFLWYNYVEVTRIRINHLTKISEDAIDNYKMIQKEVYVPEIGKVQLKKKYSLKYSTIKWRG